MKFALVFILDLGCHEIVAEMFLRQMSFYHRLYELSLSLLWRYTNISTHHYNQPHWVEETSEQSINIEKKSIRKERPTTDCRETETERKSRTKTRISPCTKRIVFFLLFIF